LDHFWATLPYRRRAKIFYSFKKFTAVIFGDKISIKETQNAINREYPTAEGFYYGRLEDNNWILKQRDKMRQCEVFLHEIGHWSGHPTRKRRIQVGIEAFKSEKSSPVMKYHYAREELIAE